MRYLDIKNKKNKPEIIELRTEVKRYAKTQKPSAKKEPRTASKKKVPTAFDSSVKKPQTMKAVDKNTKGDMARKPRPAPQKKKAPAFKPLFSKSDEPKDLWEEHDKVEQIFDNEEKISKEPEKKSAVSPEKWMKLVKSAITILIIVLLLGVALFGRAFFTGSNIFNKEGTSTLEQIKHLMLARDNKLVGENEERINVLLLGMGGEGHDGAFLTDSIIVLSIKPGTKQIAMISLPRDMWIQTQEFGYSRINKINHYGETQAGKDQGPKYVKNVAEQITGLDIPYYLRIDFEGFSEIVDSIGGVDVNIENGFIDKEYPTEDYGYQTVAFKRGIQHLDGDMALKYSRSRHGVITDKDPENKVKNEASDFARARRQQKLIAAIKDKSLSTGVVANPQKLNALFNALDKHITTNAQMWEGLRLFELTKDFEINNVKTAVISNEKYLKTYTTPEGAYTLIPVDGFGEYGKIQELVVNIFEEGKTDSLEEIPALEIPNENKESKGKEEITETEAEAETKKGKNEKEEDTAATISIQNGTTLTGLASKNTNMLRNKGYGITTFSNAAEQNRQHTVIYDNTGGKKPKQLEKLAKDLDADALNEQAPADKNGAKENVDFVIILGEESAK
ncbi:MAG: cell envelope-related transcriptional attenuator [uncultured bacterium]|nr:MAG: cell envelope-related transcriptional attenuator [uncultured bacterium]